MRILALDIASKTGWAVDGKASAASPIFGRYKLGFGMADLGLAGDQFWRFVERMIDEHEPARVVIEAPGQGHAGGGSFVTSLLSQGLAVIALTVAAGLRVPHQQIAPSTWRKAFLGHGRPEDPKRLAREHCLRLGWDVTSDDEADACGIWWWAKTTHDPAFCVPATMLPL